MCVVVLRFGMALGCSVEGVAGVGLCRVLGHVKKLAAMVNRTVNTVSASTRLLMIYSMCAKACSTGEQMVGTTLCSWACVRTGLV
jgi:hypothetical protein